MLAWRVVEANARAIGRSWATELLPSVIQPLVLCVVFGGFVASRAGRVADWSSGPTLTYAEYSVIGIICASSVISGSIEVSHLFFVGQKITSKFETVVTTPVSVTTLTVGHLLWASLYGAALSALLFVLVTPGLPRGWLLLLPVVVLTTALSTAALASLLSLIVARSSGSPQVLNVIGRVIVPPQMLLGATLFPLSALPRPLGVLLAASPVTSGTLTARAVFASRWSDAGEHLAVVLGWLLVCTTCLMISLDRELRA